MSIISCPECNRNISSRAVICNYCGFQMGEVTESDLEIFRARKLRDRIYRLNMISYTVITVFVGAFGWYWWDSRGFTEPSSMGPFILMGAAALAYLVVRGFLFHARQLKKAMRQKMKVSSELRRNL
ncbi:MAG: hypothetical protein HKN57_14095 [Xanthomonadales bacterium]|nr:hypothetical protein [Xanthomonadales bacterium]NNK51732.1 hypothetical protein [Xanthomonadales bacterium]